MGIEVYTGCGGGESARESLWEELGSGISIISILLCWESNAGD